MKLPKACEKKDDHIICSVDEKAIVMESCRWYLGINSSCKGLDNKTYFFPDVLFPVDKNDKIEEKSMGTLIVGTKIHPYDKDLYLSGYLGDIGNEGDELVLKSFSSQEVVREITVKDKTVDITAGDSITLPKNLPIYYEPWFLDRGSYLFFNPPGNMFPQGQMLKLATEGDILEEVKK